MWPICAIPLARRGDDQLYLMAGLMVCDELWEARELAHQNTREILKAAVRPEPQRQPH